MVSNRADIEVGVVSQINSPKWVPELSLFPPMVKCLRAQKENPNADNYPHPERRIT